MNTPFQMFYGDINLYQQSSHPCAFLRPDKTIPGIHIVFLTAFSLEIQSSTLETLIFFLFSLPVITDETLSFIKKSRRLLVVISPSYVHQGTQALLELKAGLENMASQGNIRLVLVQYKAIRNKKKVKELKLAQSVLKVIKWKGEKSKHQGSRFWKELHVALPVKKTSFTKNTGSFQILTQNSSFTTEDL